LSPNDFGEVEANFLDPIKEEFENQLDHYVKLINIAYIYKQCLISKLHVVNLISMVSHLCMFNTKK
jgi:hypothetical protein